MKLRNVIVLVALPGCLPLTPGAQTAHFLAPGQLEVLVVAKAGDETSTFRDGTHESNALAPTLTSLIPEVGARYGITSWLEGGVRGALAAPGAGAEADLKLLIGKGPHASVAVDAAGQAYPAIGSVGAEATGIMTIDVGPRVSLNEAGFAGVGRSSAAEPCACTNGGVVPLPAAQMDAPRDAYTWGFSTGVEVGFRNLTIMPVVSWQRLQFTHASSTDQFDHLDFVGLGVVFAGRRPRS